MTTYIVSASVALALLGSTPPTALAESVPRLYASLGPTLTYDALYGAALVGGCVMLGIGDDPEHATMLVRGEGYASFGAHSNFGGGGALLYRLALSSTDSVRWTWSVGLGALFVGAGSTVAVTVGARVELTARVANGVAFTLFMLTGPTLGEGARVPWGLPFGVAIELGAP